MVAILEVREMRSNYLAFVLMLMMLIISGANAAYDYQIPVGVHVVSFNTSSPIWEITNPSLRVTELGFKSIYSPTSPIGPAGNPMYTSSSTLLIPQNGSRPVLDITVRDFPNQISWNAMELEGNTLQGVLALIPLYGTIYMGKAITKEFNGESIGAIMDWPSDQIEIVIVGSLPSTETWKDISKSLKLER